MIRYLKKRSKKEIDDLNTQALISKQSPFLNNLKGKYQSLKLFKKICYLNVCCKTPMASFILDSVKEKITNG